MQECRATAEAQASSLSQLRGADAEDGEALELLEDQWLAAVQEAAAVEQSKEKRLQLVTDYCRQTQTASRALESLAAELDAARR